MNSASQSHARPIAPDPRDSARLVDDVQQWTRAGRRMATPVWFALSCAGIALLASVPFALVVDSSGFSGWYWGIVAPLTAVACGWYFTSRGARAPMRVGLVELAVGVLVLIGVLATVWFGSGGLAPFLPWVVVGVGFGVFAWAWRSWTAAAVAAASLVTCLVVVVAEPRMGEVLLTLVVGLTASLGAMVELVRGAPVPAP